MILSSVLHFPMLTAVIAIAFSFKVWIGIFKSCGELYMYDDLEKDQESYLHKMDILLKLTKLFKIICNWKSWNIHLHKLQDVLP